MHDTSGAGGTKRAWSHGPAFAVVGTPAKRFWYWCLILAGLASTGLLIAEAPAAKAAEKQEVAVIEI